MNDYSIHYVALQKLLKDFHEAIIQSNYAKAYEISIDIVDVSQALEDITKELLDAHTN